MVYGHRLVVVTAFVSAGACGGRIADDGRLTARCEPGAAGCEATQDTGAGSRSPPAESVPPAPTPAPSAPPMPPAPCGPGAWDHDANPATACVAKTACPSGTEVGEEGGPNVDRRCVACEQPSCVPLPVALRLAAHACALMRSGRVRCWGPNDKGQLGLGATSAPVVSPTEVPSLSQVTSVMLNDSRHTCATVASGGVLCWGANQAGQLGDGTTVERTSPVAVAGLSNAVELAMGDRHTCARTADGSVWCWGDRSMGQVGDGVISTIPRLTPAKVPNLAGVVQIAAGYGHVCARKGDGTVSCWGIGPASGVRGGTAVATPTAITALSDTKDIGAARYHACVAKTDGTAWCWGGQDLGQLGNGTLDGSTTPTRVLGLVGVERIFVGSMTGCSLHGGGALHCWGSASGVDDPTSSVRLSPTPAPVLTDVRTVGLGHANCAVTRHDVRCWGDSELLQGVVPPGTLAREPVVVPWN